MPLQPKNLRSYTNARARMEVFVPALDHKIVGKYLVCVLTPDQGNLKHAARFGTRLELNGTLGDFQQMAND
ncbi:hypothetical protein PghCCS26_13280 [Paenibacillus glycanilyticus]|uniref:Uncharacterized protein n=1 Tax=Paenibacillus glycanilyticus TaxID=126569 RepID=A0ABQ6NGI8_9BACL|nr:hypothetical protein PghCCS26_13280 [Paenibacillus glycanilyticus]